MSGTDPWSYRFGRVTPEVDTVTFRKNRGALESVVRSVRIPATDLQQVFSDTNITVHVLHGAGWSELSFYPGTNSRASRQQQLELNAALTTWSAAVARYYTAVDHLYSYLNANPQRAPYIFAFMLGEKGSDGAEPVVLKKSSRSSTLSVRRWRRSPREWTTTRDAPTRSPRRRTLSTTPSRDG